MRYIRRRERACIRELLPIICTAEVIKTFLAILYPYLIGSLTSLLYKFITCAGVTTFMTTRIRMIVTSESITFTGFNLRFDSRTLTACTYSANSSLIYLSTPLAVI